MNRKILSRLIIALAIIVAFAACSSDETSVDPTDESGPLKVAEIIINPKAPAPGDTVFLTVVLTGGSAAGDYPAVSWSSDNDSFLEKNLLTVRWMAPAGGVYEITASAKNDANSDKRSRKVFVGQPNRVHGPAGEFHMAANEQDFYYLDFSAFVNPFTGKANYVNFYDQSSNTATPVSIDQFAGNSYVFSPDLSRSAYSFTWFNFLAAPGPFADVYSNDHGSGLVDKLTRDRVNNTTDPRRNFYIFPNFSPDGSKVACTGFLPYKFPSGPDTFDVFVHDFNTGKTIDVTATHGIVRSNVFGTFSSDGNWLTFISDRNKKNSWELYGLPITGGVVATDSSATVRLTNTGGIIASGVIGNLFTPTMLWNHEPTISTAGMFVAGDGSFRLFTTTAQGATLTEVLEVVGAKAMVWSPDGTKIAVNSSGTIWLVTPGGTATEVLTAATGDQIGDVTWSPDQQWLAYRVIRGALSWFELLDIDRSDYVEPIIITNTRAPGQVVSLRGSMSTRGVITSDNLVYMLFFDDLSDATPDIWSLDVDPVVNP